MPAPGKPPGPTPKAIAPWSDWLRRPPLCRGSPSALLRWSPRWLRSVAAQRSEAIFHLPAPLPLGRPSSQCYKRGLCKLWYKVLVNLKCPWEWTYGLSWPQMPLRVQWGRSGHSLGNARICSGFQGCPGPGFRKLQPWHLQPSGSVCPGQARSWTRVPQGRSCPPPRRAGSGCAPSSSQAHPEEALHPAGPPFLPQENLWSDTASRLWFSKPPRH